MVLYGLKPPQLVQCQQFRKLYAWLKMLKVMKHRYKGSPFVYTVMTLSAATFGLGKAHSKTVELFVAAAVGNLRRLKKLAREVDKNGKGIAKTLATTKDCTGQTVLHAAAAEGMTDICKYLVDDLKLDIHLETTNGATPLLRACMDGHLSTVAYLLRKGADPNTSNDKGLTPLHYAAQIGHEELIRLLLSNGVNVDSLSSIGTPLQRAASEGKHEAVKILLDHCANPGLYFHHVPTPLSAAVAASSLRCVELLIEAGADPDAVSCGVTPLHIAACYEEIDIIKCLLKAEADADVTDDDGLKPIEAGALNGHDESVKILLPVTSPIPTYSDWSYSGIMRHVCSEEAGEQSKLKVNQMFEEMKSKGEEAFRKKDYSSAIFWYTKAINEDPSNAIVLSNRSLCWARMKEGKRALSDAMACITLKPDWPKAYYRAGAAYTILEKFDQAADVFLEGLKLAPENEDLRNALQEAVEARFKSMKASEEK